MLEIVIAKFLIKGAVKNFILTPAISATVSIIPHSTLLQATMLGRNIALTSNDLLKFGLEKIYQRFGGKRLEFQLDRIQNHIYRLIPLNPLAKLFFKEYNDEDELIVDLDIMDRYLDQLIESDLEEIDRLSNQFDQDEVVMQMLYDLDNSISRSENYLLSSVEAEKMLVEELLQKNLALMNEKLLEKQMLRNSQTSDDVITEILKDFPSVPFSPTNDEEEIDMILKKIKTKTKKKSNKTNSRTKSMIG